MASKNNDQPLKSLTPEQKEQVLFMMLIQQHRQIALVGMGEEADPATGEKETDVAAVKFAMDTLAMLQKFTEGNLTPELSDYLADTLTTLRTRFTDHSGE